MNTKLDVQTALSSLMGDSNVPKNIKNKLGDILQTLDGKEDVHLRLNRSLSELDDISNDINLPPFVITELFSVLSLLESMNTQLLTLKTTVKKKQIVEH